MTPQRFLHGRVQLYNGDCRKALRHLDAASIDSCVTDPPYSLVSIVKRFGKTSAADDTLTSERVRTRADGYARFSAGGFMGQKWDTGEVAFDPKFWRRVYRVLKPGAHLLAFGGTRTYHRLVCAIEDAGFEVRDCIIWAYGSGFPKSHDVSKGIDATLLHGGSNSRRLKRANDGRTGPGRLRPRTQNNGIVTAVTGDKQTGRIIKDTPSTPEGEQWAGWGTALKPAAELVVLARKPLSERTVAKNVLAHGTGALNIDACRVGMEGGTRGENYAKTGLFGIGGKADIQSIDAGRWPANLIHDGSDEVAAAFPHSVSTDHSKYVGIQYGQDGTNLSNGINRQGKGHNDSGSAARFFYQVKADIDDRLALKHPTVKPVDLMAYLIKLVTPPGGTVLDCFAGTGTTAEAAYYQGLRAILIEREPEYQGYIRERLRIIRAGGYERLLVKNKHRARAEPIRPGQFF
jgi:site-specific DNA-methyltransferase (adenine-specific)